MSTDFNAHQFEEQVLRVSVLGVGGVVVMNSQC
jgi:hypothetical protein